MDYMYSQPRCRNLTYGELCSLLEKRFSAAQSLATDKKKLRKRRKQKGETYRHMGQEILRLASRVYRGAPGMVDEESKEQFIRALLENLRLAVAASNPRTMEESVENVTQLCAILDTD